MTTINNEGKKFLRRGIRKKSASLMIVGVLILGIGYGLQQANTSKPAEKQIAAPGTYRVVEFYDGDTIAVDMNGIHEKVRMIGVDTPETHDPRKAVQCYGQAASDFTKNLIGQNTVRLEADPLNQNRDRYNRLLRYVYLPDGRLVNAEIIKQGYGFAYTSFPFQKVDDFRAFQKSAQDQKLGLWGSCTPQTNQYGGYTSNDAQ